MHLIDPKHLPGRSLVSHKFLSLTERAFVKGWNACINDILDNVQQVEAEPIHHGYWWDKGSLSCRCSACGCKNNKESAYCPNCGAKMSDKEVQPNE